jgi:hypothetical protein
LQTALSTSNGGLIEPSIWLASFSGDGDKTTIQFPCLLAVPYEVVAHFIENVYIF